MVIKLVQVSQQYIFRRPFCAGESQAGESFAANVKFKIWRSLTVLLPTRLACGQDLLADIVFILIILKTLGNTVCT